MSGREYSLHPAYDFRARDTYIPEAYSAGKTRRRAQGAKRRRSTFKKSAAAVLGTALAAAAIFGSLLLQLRLTEISAMTLETQAAAEELEEQQIRLRLEYSRLFSPERLEQAAREMGMCRPGADQTNNKDSSP